MAEGVIGLIVFAVIILFVRVILSTIRVLTKRTNKKGDANFSDYTFPDTDDDEEELEPAHPFIHRGEKIVDVRTDDDTLKMVDFQSRGETFTLKLTIKDGKRYDVWIKEKWRPS